MDLEQKQYIQHISDLIDLHPKLRDYALSQGKTLTGYQIRLKREEDYIGCQTGSGGLPFFAKKASKPSSPREFLTAKEAYEWYTS